ncbi:4-(cytidine 5'-diphospho)-2-C-methyl-D-erythritol kinase [Reinekea sp.]|uniref:4-(cytidine 5'-diphospho)-2-C-methyl-D-erythritol kinase n=1 Tax=Reinekea sp. TaxID=1970455 RepID=UPI002A8129BF|nr:4-(cytidine 5'-diphospho)-2-C-methyl-D-erythritol kinase [Reinekea sp.]
MPVNSLTLIAPAKLNLFLHIIGRRPDGFHQLQTLFQLLDYGDELTFTLDQNEGVVLTCSQPELVNADNLVIRAAQALAAFSGQSFNVHIHLDKRLPLGGGIGGGSSDAATTLLALNHLYQLQVCAADLLMLAAGLGADVPVFVNGQTAWAEGIGDRLTPMSLPERWYLVVFAQQHVATPLLFAHPQLTRDTPASTIRAALAETGHNDFEALVRKLYPLIDRAFQACQPYGHARLTGTGACLFLTLPSERAGSNLLNRLTLDHPELSVFLAKGVNHSPALRRLRQQAD